MKKIVRKTTNVLCATTLHPDHTLGIYLVAMSGTKVNSTSKFSVFDLSSAKGINPLRERVAIVLFISFEFFK